MTALSAPAFDAPGLGDVVVNDMPSSLPDTLLPSEPGQATMLEGLFQTAKALVPSVAPLVKAVKRAKRDLFDCYFGGGDALIPVCYRLMAGLGWRLGEQSRVLPGGRAASSFWREVLCFEGQGFKWAAFRFYAPVYHCTLEGQPWHGASLLEKYKKMGCSLTRLAQAATAVLDSAQEDEEAAAGAGATEEEAGAEEDEEAALTSTAATEEEEAGATAGATEEEEAAAPSQGRGLRPRRAGGASAGAAAAVEGGGLKQRRLLRRSPPQEQGKKGGGVLYASQLFCREEGEAWVDRVRGLVWRADGGDGALRIPGGIFPGLSREKQAHLRANGYVVVDITNPALQRERHVYGRSMLGMFTELKAGSSEVDGDVLIETLIVTEAGTPDDRYSLNYLHDPDLRKGGLHGALASIPDIIVRETLGSSDLPLNSRCVLVTGPRGQKQKRHHDGPNAATAFHDFSVLMPLLRPRKLYVYAPLARDGGYRVLPGLHAAPMGMEVVVTIGVNQFLLWHAGLCHAGAEGDDHPLPNLAYFARTGPPVRNVGVCVCAGRPPPTAE